MSLLDTWAAYCARHGYNFSVYTRGVDIILDSSDNYHYYEEVGFDGLARDLSGDVVQEAGADQFEWNNETGRLEFRKVF